MPDLPTSLDEAVEQAEKSWNDWLENGDPEDTKSGLRVVLFELGWEEREAEIARLEAGEPHSCWEQVASELGFDSIEAFRRGWRGTTAKRYDELLAANDERDSLWAEVERYKRDAEVLGEAYNESEEELREMGDLCDKLASALERAVYLLDTWTTEPRVQDEINAMRRKGAALAEHHERRGTEA